MEEKKKIKVSADWTGEERRRLIGLIQAELTPLKEKDTYMRRTAQWETPAIKQNLAKINWLSQLIEYVSGATETFLETNRQNYEDYLEE